jgi:hypothetical protein
MDKDKKPNINNTTILANIYAQDCEFYRYMDKLKWSRFKTISVIEGAIFLALYKEKISPTTDIKVIILIGIIFIMLLSLLSLRDADRQRRYLIRIKEYEILKFPTGNSLLKITTEKFVGLAAIIINIVNIFLYVFNFISNSSN